MYLVLDIGPQRDHGPLHRDVEYPRLQPNQQCGKQIQTQRQQQGATDGAEVHAAAGHHVHARQQVGERVVAAGPGSLDGLLLGQTGGQLASDHAVEQQVGGMAEDPRTDHTDRDAADPEQDHRRGQPALRCQPLDQPDCRAREVAGPLHRRLHRAANRRAHRSTERRGHFWPPTPAPTDCESANSA